METDILGIEKLLVAIVSMAKEDLKKKAYKEDAEKFFKSEWYKLINLYLSR